MGVIIGHHQKVTRNIHVQFYFALYHSYQSVNNKIQRRLQKSIIFIDVNVTSVCRCNRSKHLQIYNLENQIQLFSKTFHFLFFVRTPEFH